ncbi:MAG: hypothetical protein RMI85_06040 [Candidatus Korarchaeum sp.]|nr:hypothetical protein [Candidatus Korarchaeum sp.]
MPDLSRSDASKLLLALLLTFLALAGVTMIYITRKLPQETVTVVTTVTTGSPTAPNTTPSPA